MPTFTLDGVAYDCLRPKPDAGPEATHSWKYGHWPRVEVAVPLAAGGTVSVYGQASRWAGSYILMVWVADAGAHHSTWIPKDNVRRLTRSEWDIIEFHRTPENLRMIRWGDPAARVSPGVDPPGAMRGQRTAAQIV